jgi:hypothetical protein
MGIPGLNKWISANFPGVMQSLQDGGKSGGGARAQAGGGRVVTPYDHVLFDLNGIVHRACRKCPSEKKVMEDIVKELDSLLLLFPATTSVLIALDGAGPTAKLMEQRKRRIDKTLKDARDAQALIPGSPEHLRRLELYRVQAQSGTPPLSSKKHKKKSTDSLQVTPGTMFMLRLKRVLEWYAVSRACGVAGVFASRTPIVLVSAADVSGEGELKLLQHVHAVLRTPLSRDAPLPSFLLVGPDSDLLLLALASGTPRCDVLTADAKGCHKLFTVQALCDIFLRQLGPTPQPCTAPLGGMHQLDFLVLSFLMGNDYVPKLRGARLPHLWSTLARLLRGGEFRGQHLLLPSEGRVEINMRLLVALTGSSCVSVRGAGARAEADEDDEDSDDDESSDEKEQDDEDHGDATAESSSHGRASWRGADVDGYLRTLAWCACMYLSGCCPDYSVTYASRTSPTAAQLAAFAAKKEQESGSACRPCYMAPTPGGTAASAPLAPDVFCMCLLPAAGAAYLPRPLQTIMLNPSHPLADIFRANQIWPHDLVRRVTETVASVPLSAYTAEERACVALGLVTAVIPATQGQPAVPLPPWLRGCKHSPLRASPPSPFGPGGDIKALGKAAVAHVQPDVSGSCLARWSWWGDNAGAGCTCSRPEEQPIPATQPSPACTKGPGAPAQHGVPVLPPPFDLSALDAALVQSSPPDGGVAVAASAAGVTQQPCRQTPAQSFADAAYAFLLNRPAPATSATTAVRLSVVGAALAHRIRDEKIKLQRWLQGHPLMFRVVDVEKPGFAAAYVLVND